MAHDTPLPLPVGAIVMRWPSRLELQMGALSCQPSNKPFKRVLEGFELGFMRYALGY